MRTRDKVSLVLRIVLMIGMVGETIFIYQANTTNDKLDGIATLLMCLTAFIVVSVQSFKGSVRD